MVKLKKKHFFPKMLNISDYRTIYNLNESKHKWKIKKIFRGVISSIVLALDLSIGNEKTQMNYSVLSFIFIMTLQPTIKDKKIVSRVDFFHRFNNMQ